MDYKQITYEIINRIAMIGFGKYSKKPRPTLELETLVELDTVLQDIRKKQDKDIAGLVFFSHKKNIFLAGMNVKVIRDLVTVEDGISGARDGQEICSQIEDLEIPTIACVDGVCIGGGTELVLACKIIALSDSPYTSLGLPEVQLGLLPAFGGTYRLPRRINLSDALDLILSGRMVSAKDAKKMGLADRIYPAVTLVEMAIAEYITERNEKTDRGASVRKGIINNPIEREAIFKKARETVLKETGGHLEIPFRILNHMESSLGKRRSIHLQSEANLLGEIAISMEARNLQNIYWLHANSQIYRGPASARKKIILKKGAVVGAGTMGSGITWLMAKYNMTPLLKDINKEKLESALEQSRVFFSGEFKRKKVSEDKAREKHESIKTQLNYHNFRDIDLVSEAVDEDIGIKKNILSEIENEVNEDCIITSCTDSLSINEMAAALSRPERFAGLHLFNPVNIVQLVEIIKHDRTAPETISTLYEWLVRIKKVPVVVNDSPCFLVNRILAVYINEALYMLEEGVPAHEIEKACISFGMPAGPFRLLETAGIVACQGIINKLYVAIGNRFTPASAYRKLTEKKDIYKLPFAGKIKINENEIQDRIIMPIINEAAYILRDRVAETPEDIDLALVFGAGFPGFRGGLLKYADNMGLASVLKLLDQYAKDVDSNRFKACAIIRTLAENNEKFYNNVSQYNEEIK